MQSLVSILFGLKWGTEVPYRPATESGKTDIEPQQNCIKIKVSQKGATRNENSKFIRNFAKLTKGRIFTLSVVISLRKCDSINSKKYWQS